MNSQIALSMSPLLLGDLHLGSLVVWGRRRCTTTTTTTTSISHHSSTVIRLLHIGVVLVLVAGGVLLVLVLLFPFLFLVREVVVVRVKVAKVSEKRSRLAKLRLPPERPLLQKRDRRVVEELDFEADETLFWRRRPLGVVSTIVGGLSVLTETTTPSAATAAAADEQ
ncbi:hypothetical protein TYRP_006647 [Tyrophagus putrescentiae]|nr:hypothetical protein TYRP_006647 [Tyrophagus putrescentiae]